MTAETATHRCSGFMHNHRPICVVTTRAKKFLLFVGGGFDFSVTAGSSRENKHAFMTNEEGEKIPKWAPQYAHRKCSGSGCYSMELTPEYEFFEWPLECLSGLERKVILEFCSAENISISSMGTAILPSEEEKQALLEVLVAAKKQAQE